jgi:predicted CoA-binding protein
MLGDMDITQILEDTRTIAVVGLSDDPDKASNEVAVYLRDYYEIIPVNPNREEVLGLKCYPDLESIPVKVDMVDVFQRSENIPPLVEPAIAIGAKVFWMQLGIENADAARRLQQAGITVVQNRCAKLEHARRAG